jgi:hypothetical protein
MYTIGPHELTPLALYGPSLACAVSGVSSLDVSDRQGATFLAKVVHDAHERVIILGKADTASFHLACAASSQASMPVSSSSMPQQKCMCRAQNESYHGAPPEECTAQKHFPFKMTELYTQ